MKVFITGGTGYVGSVLVERLVAAGHEVTALARSDASSARLTRAGATPLRGELADASLLRAAADAADAVVHAAVDYSMSDEANATELAAVRALVAGAGETDAGKPVIFTSTGFVYGFDPARDASEDAELPESSAQPVKALAELTGATPASIPLAVAQERFGPAAHVLASTSRMTAGKARSVFAWEPAGIALLDDIRSGSYRALASGAA